MTLRMSWLYVVMASFAFMISDVAATRAQVTPCSIDPNICYYGNNGRYYWSPSGHRLQYGTATPSDGGARKPAVKKKTPNRGSADGR